MQYKVLDYTVIYLQLSVQLDTGLLRDELIADRKLEATSGLLSNASPSGPSNTKMVDK